MPFQVLKVSNICPGVGGSSSVQIELTPQDSEKSIKIPGILRSKEELVITK